MDSMDLNEMQTNLEKMSLHDLQMIVSALSLQIDNPNSTAPMYMALGYYMKKLMDQFQFLPVYPMEFAPLRKDTLKIWGFRCGKMIAQAKGELRQFQQDGILCYVRFQEISPEQWAKMQNDYKSEIMIYNLDMRDKGSSGVALPSEYKAILDKYRREYQAATQELHAFLNNSMQSRAGCGCASSIAALFMLFALITWGMTVIF